MVDTYSPNLALILQDTGTNSGVWGTLTNTNLGTLIEQAISGYVTQAITDGAATVITIPNGATGVARNMTLELTGALTAARVLEVPANKKLYFIYNNTTGGYAVTVKVSGQTGVSVPNGKKMILVSNGTDIVEAVNYAGTISGGSLTLTGNLSVGGTSGFTGVATFTAQPIMSSLTASQAVFTDGSKGLVSNAITGTGNVVMSNSPTLVTPALGTPASGVVTNLTGTASININGTVGATTPTTGAFTTLSASSSVTFSGGTANGVVYLNGSKVATSGSALVFDGSNLGLGVTPSAWSSGIKAFDFGSTGAIYSVTDAVFAHNAYVNASSTWTYKTTAGASYYQQYAGKHQWFNASSGTAGNPITFTQAMSLSASGVLSLETPSSGNGSFSFNGSTFSIISNSSSAPIVFGTNSTERMRLDSSGNLGIGTTSPGAKLDVQTTNSRFRLSDSGGSQYFDTLNTAASAWYPFTHRASQFAWGINSGTGNLILDSSGNLGLGVTPSAWSTSYRAIQNTSGFFSVDGNAANYTTIYGNNAYYSSANSRWEYYRSSNGASLYRQNNGSSGLAEHAWYTAPSGTAGNPITFTQAMTLDASGNLLVGQTSVSTTTAGSAIQQSQGVGTWALNIAGAQSTNSYYGYYLYSTGAAAYRFYVGYGGTIYATSTSITAISDITLKENIRPLETGLAEVLKLQPRRFDWKNGDGTDVAGFIAQEVVDVLPDLVSDYKYNDTETKKAVKMGDMIPTLVKAIQEQQEIINDLRARVANLEKL